MIEKSASKLQIFTMIFIKKSFSWMAPSTSETTNNQSEQPHKVKRLSLFFIQPWRCIAAFIRLPSVVAFHAAIVAVLNNKWPHRSDSNKIISGKEPKDYFFSLVPLADFNKILESNILPLDKSIYQNNDSDRFLDRRGDVIISALDKLTTWLRPAIFFLQCCGF